MAESKLQVSVETTTEVHTSDHVSFTYFYPPIQGPG